MRIWTIPSAIALVAASLVAAPASPAAALDLGTGGNSFGAQTGTWETVPTRLGNAVAVSSDFTDSVRVILSPSAGLVRVTTTTGLTVPTGYDPDMAGDVNAENIAFVGTRANVNAALATLQYQGAAAGSATIGITANDEIVSNGQAYYYNPDNGHYYWFDQTLRSWDDARAAAKTSTFQGFNGYLANVSDLAENMFIFNHASNVTGWLGGTDKAGRTGTYGTLNGGLGTAGASFTVAEGTWRWMDGPEAGKILWRFQNASTNNTYCGFGNHGNCTFDGVTAYSRWQCNDNNTGGSQDLPAYVCAFPNNSGNEPNGGTGENFLQMGFRYPGCFNCGNPVLDTWPYWNDLEGNQTWCNPATATRPDIYNDGCPAGFINLGGLQPSIVEYSGTNGQAITLGTASRTLSVTIGANPATPTVTSVVAGDGKAAVTWTAPSSDGGSPITGYTASSGARTCTAVAPALTCTVTGLTNGTAYSFSVTAANAIGSGSSSGVSSAVVPRPYPAAPGSVALSGANLSWASPALTYSSSQDRAYVFYRATADTTGRWKVLAWKSWSSGGGSITLGATTQAGCGTLNAGWTCVVPTALTPGTSYQYRVAMRRPDADGGAGGVLTNAVTHTTTS